MLRTMMGLLALGAVCAGPLAAQTDYRNLDDGRPVATEDAWPIEHRAFEFLAPYALARANGQTESVVTPELGWGIVRNAMIGGKLPVLLGDGGGIAGPRAFLFYNFNAESGSFPGFALRADVAFPGGDASGRETTLALKAIATRSWGKFRTHLNVVHSLGDGTATPLVEPAPRWGGSLAGDFVALRRSTVFLIEVSTAQSVAGADFEWAAATGLRTQLNPTLVFDIGVGSSLGRDDGNEMHLTVGLSHTFGIGALWPRGGK